MPQRSSGSCKRLVSRARHNSSVNAPTADQVRELLRQVRWPGFQLDIVAAGFVKDIRVDAGRAHVRLAPQTSRADKIATMEAEIHRVLAGIIDADIETVPMKKLPVLSEGTHRAPELEVVAAAGLTADPEPRWDGGAPGTRGKTARYEGPIPVPQWDIDPSRADAVRGDADVVLGEWEYRMWWQRHESELSYVSIQAIEDDSASDPGLARPHPVGRAVAVNLVYDHHRNAIVAIYGTTRDFRPFVEAFRRGFLGEVQP